MTNSDIYAIEQMKLTDKVDKMHISGKFSSNRTKLMFFKPVSNFTVFEPRIQTDFTRLELGQLRLFWWIIS